MPFSYHHSVGGSYSARALFVILALSLASHSYGGITHTHTQARCLDRTVCVASFLTSQCWDDHTHFHPSLFIFASLCSSGCTLTGYGAHAGLELKVIPLAQTPKVWGHQCTSGGLGHLPGYLRALSLNPLHGELVLLSHLQPSFFPLPRIRAGSKSSCPMLIPMSLHSSFLPSLLSTVNNSSHKWRRKINMSCCHLWVTSYPGFPGSLFQRYAKSRKLNKIVIINSNDKKRQACDWLHRVSGMAPDLQQDFPKGSSANGCSLESSS